MSNKYRLRSNVEILKIITSNPGIKWRYIIDCHESSSANIDRSLKELRDNVDVISCKGRYYTVSYFDEHGDAAKTDAVKRGVKSTNIIPLNSNSEQSCIDLMSNFDNLSRSNPV